MPPPGPFGPYGFDGRGPPRDDVVADIERFCDTNRLEARCETVLRELSPATARKVMGLGGGANTFELRGDVRNPTAVVLARVKKARDERYGRRDDDDR